MADPLGEPGGDVRAAARLFNDRLYFEAHDVLEEEWAGARGPRRPVLQALVKLAAGMYHLQTSNFAGAESLLSSGLHTLRAAADASAVAVGSGLRVLVGPLADPVDSALKKIRAVRAGAAPSWGAEDLPKFFCVGGGERTSAGSGPPDRDAAFGARSSDGPSPADRRPRTKT